MEIKIQIPEGSAPLYSKYPGQTSPQSAHMEIDPCAESVRWDYSGEIGNAVPSDVWHGRVLQVPCSCYLSEQELRDLTKAHLPTIQRVIDGHESYWNGSNYIGRLDEDGQAALDEIEELLRDEQGEAVVWDAGDWLEGGTSPARWADLCGEAGIDPERGAEVLQAVVDFVAAEADREGTVLTNTDSAVEEKLNDYLAL